MTVDLPLRESPEIQGDILAGFKKDHVSLLFLQFGNAVSARHWLEEITPQIATTAQVADFNADFSKARQTSGGDDPKTLKATWLGLSFTHPGLQLFSGQNTLFPNANEGNTLGAFVQGASERALALGDTDDSDPMRWVFGYDHSRTIHAILTVAADDPEDLGKMLTRLRDAVSRADAVVVYQQDAATLPGKRRGKEHFGFKDGVSEPGVRGFDEEDPNRPGYALETPGTRLIPAGEFVVGRERVDTGFPRNYPEKDIPAWMHDGSFQVVRRLAQDVPGWWANVDAQLKELKAAKAVDENTTTEWLAARLVGRWRSGASVAGCPVKPHTTPDARPDNDITYARDPDGLTTPLFSHLRKSNPRDGLVDGGELVDEKFIDTRRIIRRGAPYGAPFDPANDEGGGPDDPRGLLFVCYQADLVDQFEFIQADWINDPDFPHGRAAKPGPDPMVSGQLSGVNDGKVSFESQSASGERKTTTLHFRPFVRTEGSVYAFAPSISTLRRLAQGRLTGEMPPMGQTQTGQTAGGQTQAGYTSSGQTQAQTQTQRPGAAGRLTGGPVDAVVAFPDQQGRSWVFQQSAVRQVGIPAGEDAALATWPALKGIGRIDTILPIPDEQSSTGGANSYWVFHTMGGEQVYRYVSLAGRDPYTSSSAGRDRPLSLWNSFGGVTHVDAFLPVPDQQPDGGRAYYWMFHTTPQGQRYRLMSVSVSDGGQHGDRQDRSDRNLSMWASLNGIDKVDAFRAVPGKQRVDGESWFWVFHQNQMRVIKVADGRGHPDTLVQDDRPVTDWTGQI